MKVVCLFLVDIVERFKKDIVFVCSLGGRIIYKIYKVGLVGKEEEILSWVLKVEKK